MQRISIVGGKKLDGEIEISGAKNSALPILAATLLTGDRVILHGVPRLGDVYVMSELLRNLGVKLDWTNGTFEVEAGIDDISNFESNNLLTRIRYSTHLIGALLPKFKEVNLPLPGGCVIGTRRLDSHLLGFRSMGATVKVVGDMIRVSADELHGCDVRLEFPSVGATENLLIAASVADGTSMIENAAREPEIVDLANFLNSMGARITGAGGDVIKIQGVEELSGTEYSIVPDRIETGTYAVAAAVTDGDLFLKKARPDHLDSVIAILREIGVEIDYYSGGIHVQSSGGFNPVDIVTEIYPGFPTDMQPIITTLLARASGQSSIRETIYDSRFTHVPELLKMGAKINREGDVLRISGVDELRGADINALDIRCGGALVLAGLSAKGKTNITGVEQILRGYENPVEKLRNVGAEISLC